MFVVGLGGKETRKIELHVADSRETDAPKIIASEAGLSPGGVYLRDTSRAERDRVEKVMHAIRSSPGGAYVAFLGNVGGHRLIAIQTNRGPFYEGRHSRVHGDIPIWRDYYYATLHVALLGACQLWGPNDILVNHPTGKGWPPHLMEVVIESIGHLADTLRLPLERVTIGRCCLGNARETIATAVATLAREQSGPARPTARPVAWEWRQGAFDTAGFGMVAEVTIPGATDSEE